MSPAQVNKNKKYFLLDQSEHLDVVLHGTADDFKLALRGAVDVTNIEKAIIQEKVFSYGKANNCIIVEDFDYNDTLKEISPKNNDTEPLKKEAGEEWRSFKIGGHDMWYVSNQGRTKRKKIATGEESALVTKVNRNGELYAIVGRKREIVKNLVAMTFMRDEWKKYADPVVINIDGNSYNCAVSNLEIGGEKS